MKACPQEACPQPTSIALLDRYGIVFPAAERNDFSSTGDANDKDTMTEANPNERDVLATHSRTRLPTMQRVLKTFGIDEPRQRNAAAEQRETQEGATKLGLQTVSLAARKRRTNAAP